MTNRTARGRTGEAAVRGGVGVSVGGVAIDVNRSQGGGD